MPFVLRVNLLNFKQMRHDNFFLYDDYMQYYRNFLPIIVYLGL